MSYIDSIVQNSTAAMPGAGIDAAQRKNDQFGKDAFLKLLVAQLKYQDPMNPAEGAEFMAQTAQFTMVEKLQELSEMNTELLASQRTMAGSSLIGRTVSFAGPDGVDISGVVDGLRVTIDGPILQVGDFEVPLGSVKEVAAAAPVAVAPPAPATTETESPETASPETPATDGAMVEEPESGTTD